MQYPFICFKKSRAPNLERVPAAQRLVKHNAERENIRSLIGRFFLQRFRSHIGKRAAEVRALRGFQRGSVFPQQRPCQAEVENLQLAFSIQHQVFGFDVAMLHAALVSGCQGRSALFGDFEKFSNGERLFQAPPQRLAFDVFHHQENVVARFEYVEDRRDVRVVQSRGAFRFLPESLAVAFVLANRGRDSLQRYKPLQPRVFGAIYLSHAAGAKQIANHKATFDRPAQLGRDRRGIRLRSWISHRKVLARYRTICSTSARVNRTAAADFL